MGTKLDQGKVRFDLLNWGALWEIAEVLRDGAAVYGDRNWEQGMYHGRIFSAMMRHAAKYAMGEELDSDSGYRHLAHIGAGVMMLMGVTVEYPELDDRSKLANYNKIILGVVPDDNQEEVPTTTP